MTKIIKSECISKTKNRTKIIIYAKNKRRVISNRPYEFGHFWRKLNFWGPKTPLLDARCAQTIEGHCSVWLWFEFISKHNADIVLADAVSTCFGGDLPLVNAVDWRNYISFQMEWDVTVVTVFLSISNQMEFHLIQNWKENRHHDHIPFNLKGNVNIVFSV